MDDFKMRIPPDFDRVFEFRTAGMVPPNRVIFGFRAIEQIGVEVAHLTKGKVLIASDEAILKLGILDKIQSFLALAGFEAKVFTDIGAEPHVENAEALYNQCLSGDFSILIGIGGGSVMDVTKLVALSGGHKQPPRDFLEGKVKLSERGLPMILIPTTAGTGSEVSPYSVVKIGEKKYFPMSPFFYPDIAIIDPGLTISMPPFITASTGMDALSHAIEGMMHKNANPFSDSLCLDGAQMIGSYLRRAVGNGGDLEARYYMSLGATLCMMGMSMSGGLYAHSVSFVVGKYKPTPHGVGVSLGLPYLMAFNLPVVSAKLAKIAAALGEPIWMYSEQEAAKRAIHAIKSLMTDIGLPVTLKDYGISEKDIPDMANMMIKLYPRPMNPRSMDQESSMTYWRNMWNGTL